MDRKYLERISLLVRIKKTEEKICAQEFAKIRKKISDIESEIENIEEERKMALSNINSLMLTSNLRDVTNYYDYVCYLENEMAKLANRLKEVRQEEEAKRVDLEKKIQKRKIFEQLQERKKVEIEHWVDKEFQKGLDDIVISRWDIK